MRTQRRSEKRRGAILIEAVLTTTVFVSMVFGLIDLAIALYHNHVASEAARQGARTAIVHGYFASDNSNMSSWGPTPSYYAPLSTQTVYSSATSYAVQANDTADELATTIRPYLVGLDPSQVTIEISWPDGNNDPGNRVTVSVTTAYCFPMPLLFGLGPFSSGASSTMTIAH